MVSQSLPYYHLLRNLFRFAIEAGTFGLTVIKAHRIDHPGVAVVSMPVVHLDLDQRARCLAVLVVQRVAAEQ